MEYKSFLIKYGEIGVKGKNRNTFEEALVKQLRHALERVGGSFTVSRERGRIYVDVEDENYSQYDYEDTIEAMKTVFGIVAICPMIRIEDRDYENLKKQAVAYINEAYSDKNFTFKVDTRRADKTYPGTSEVINAEIGEVVLNAFPEIKVDVHKPDVMLKIEIRNKI